MFTRSSSYAPYLALMSSFCHLYPNFLVRSRALRWGNYGVAGPQPVLKLNASARGVCCG